ncbi:MAG TPA: UV DNA damage repair endonuclease UvsE [Thermoanaerobaculia bacterium]|nr:UV DNA damage repair endonuclease UvsE [Thermoanaerobaculia bacterium]
MAPRRARRLGFAVKVLGKPGLKSHDARRWQSGPSLGVSIEALHAIFDYLAAAGISMYRLSSDFVPYSTHPDLPQFHGQIERHARELEGLAARARELDLRLSLHPSQYVVLNAADPQVMRKSIADLDVQAQLLDALRQGPEGVVVLHVGGLYGDRRAALDRFGEGFRQLSESARRRLVIENDESCFTVEDCVELHERLGTPVIFDHQHHRLNPGSLDLFTAARRALATWPAGVRPKVHFSSPRLDGREVQRGKKVVLEAPLLRQHADYVDPWTFADFLDGVRDVDFDVMLEAKAKDLALLRLKDDLERIGRAEGLLAPLLSY